jgi:hypothetical protein
MDLDQARRPGLRSLFERNAQPADRLALFDDPRHPRRQTQTRAAALDFDRDVAAGRAAHEADELHSVGDRLTVHGQKAIARAQARSFARTARGDVVHQRVRVPSRQIETESGQQFAGFGHDAPVLIDAQRHRPLAAVTAHAQRQHAVVGELPDQRDLQLFRVPDPAIADANDEVPALQSGRRRGTARAHLPDHRLDDLRPHHRQNRVQDRSE